ncbi:diuretic hormone class 2 [Belonocnema kinseyi]|uniref:diuretic hormone class 2 n=1 Tax=Belonocnema kinseyi TaxID=2817044 RepID=UPI00143D9CC1|nr:diuretic hormone class 2 [Belonocnema kinseyi]
MNWMKILSICMLLTLSSTSLIEAFSKGSPLTTKKMWQLLEEYYPRIIGGVFKRFKNIQLQKLDNAKRGLDLGLSRGISGTQSGKHLIGLNTAQFSDGPGRRRRSE